MVTEKDGKRRRRVYGGLLIFVVFAGILMIGLPQLRTRLFDRIHLIRNAVTGETPPDILPMGELGILYPEEFARQASPENPNAPRSAILRQPAEPDTSADTVSRRRLTVVSPEGISSSKTQPANDSTDLTPRFQQGVPEREAYEKVLAANTLLSGMVEGGNPQLRFKTWDAARRGEELYWVRVIFTSTVDAKDANDSTGKDVEYIWQVEGANDKVTPLNFNARSL